MGYFATSTEAPVLAVALGLGTVLAFGTNICGCPFQQQGLTGSYLAGRLRGLIRFSGVGKTTARVSPGGGA